MIILDFIIEHIPILKHLPDFSSCPVLAHILVLGQLLELISMSIFKHLRSWVTKQDFLPKYKRIENKNCSSII